MIWMSRRQNHWYSRLRRIALLGIFYQTAYPSFGGHRVRFYNFIGWRFGSHNASVGTGKTHTIALSLLRLFNVYANTTSEPGPDSLSPKIVFVTAVTHAAIDAVLKKLTYLIQCYRSIDSLPNEWLDKIFIEHVKNGNEHAAPSVSSAFSLFAGTIFQVR